ncbi:unnamed protein product [Trichobilharzia szidati]|nr:unnamed protein product [Trichobilharzia szidati]
MDGKVKKLMEEAVIRSYVHEDSETVTKFCSSVEAVLFYGLRRSIFTWIEEETTFVLCQKIAKQCPEAQQTLDRLDYYKQSILKRRNDHRLRRNISPIRIKSTSSNSLTSSEKSSSSPVNFTFWSNDNNNNNNNNSSHNHNISNYNNNTLINGRRDTLFQNFWIRVALLEKVLDKIVYFLTINSSQYYEQYSLMADPCDGQLISDLLRGPCTIDYSRTRTTDHLFTDPPVSELIQRHGIYGGLMSRQLSYVPPVSQQLLEEKIQENDDENEDGDDDDVMKIMMVVIKSLNNEHNDGSTEKIKGRCKYINIPAITMNPVEEEKEEDNDDGKDELDNEDSGLPIDSIINHNRKRYNTRKVDLNINNPSVLNQTSWMTKRSSSPLISVNDLLMSRGSRTGSCAFLPQINEYNSTKTNRNQKSTKDIAMAAKDHVESMHQNLKSRLLYGKNNVLMQPPNSPDPIPGYLSLIDGESGKLIVLKWTPNSAVTNQQNLSLSINNINTVGSNTCGSSNNNIYSSMDSLVDSRMDIDSIGDKETYWGYAIKIKMDDIVYAHCHESSDQYTVILIRNDGIQLAPFHFYAQSHVLTFLNCLEQGLSKFGGYLDPSSDLPATSPCGPSFFNKSYRPSMPFIFASRNSLIPSTINNNTNNSNSNSKLDSLISHSSTSLTQMNSSSTASTTTTAILKSSKSDQSIPLTTGSGNIGSGSGGGGGGIKHRLYLNLLKAFNQLDELNSEDSRRTSISPSLDSSSTEKSPVQHTYQIVSKTGGVTSPKFKTSPTGFDFIKTSVMSRKISLQGISEENIDDSNANDEDNENVESDAETVRLTEKRTTPDVCTKLRIKILSHVFHKWYKYFNKIQIVRKKLSNLVSTNLLTVDSPTNAEEGVTVEFWKQLMSNSIPKITFNEFCRHIYFGNCDPTIRNEVWPYLLGLYPWDSTREQLNVINKEQTEIYTNALNTWNRVVDCLQQDTKYASFLGSKPIKCETFNAKNFTTDTSEVQCSPAKEVNGLNTCDTVNVQQTNGVIHSEINSVNTNGDIKAHLMNSDEILSETSSEVTGSSNHSMAGMNSLPLVVNELENNASQKQCEFSSDILDAFADNLYRIDKDVSRCDRNHVFFMTPKKSPNSNSNDFSELSTNLYKLRNIISTWVWLNLDVGYIQGMCDLLAPILIIMNDEIISFGCFTCLMQWMLPNFPLINNNNNILLINPHHPHHHQHHRHQYLPVMGNNMNETINSTTGTSPTTTTATTTTTTTKTTATTTTNRKTLLQLAVKAAKRRTTTVHSRGDTGVGADIIHTKHGLVDNPPHHQHQHLHWLNKTKDDSVLQYTSTAMNGLDHVDDSNDDGGSLTSNEITSPYDRILLNTNGIQMSCMDMRFHFLQSLIEIFDPEMNQHLSKKVPEGQLFFSYRWLLLDFKRELKYDDIFPVWETIWASRRLVSYDFGIFFALALLEYYRDIIIYYDMDVTEIIRFYNELTEQHDAITLLELARSFVFQLQHLTNDQ